MNKRFTLSTMDTAGALVSTSELAFLFVLFAKDVEVEVDSIPFQRGIFEHGEEIGPL